MSLMWLSRSQQETATEDAFVFSMIDFGDSPVLEERKARLCHKLSERADEENYLGYEVTELQSISQTGVSSIWQRAGVMSPATVSPR